MTVTGYWQERPITDENDNKAFQILKSGIAEAAK
jgi:hypothetical protein